MLQSNLHIGFSSRVFDSTVLPACVNLLVQRNDSVGQPVSNHTDSSQAALFQEINFIG
jgi:hypothetical protein